MGTLMADCYIEKDSEATIWDGIGEIYVDKDGHNMYNIISSQKCDKGYKHKVKNRTTR